MPRPAMLVEMVTAPGAPAPRDDRGLRLVVLRVQHLAADPRRAERRRELLRLADARRADQHRPARRVHPRDLGDEGRALRLLVREDDVGLVGADHRPVGRDDDRAQAVERLELLGRGVRGGGHAGEARVEAEEVLQRDLAQDAALGA